MGVKKILSKFLWCYGILNLLLLIVNLTIVMNSDVYSYVNWQKLIICLSVYTCFTMIIIFEMDSISITRQLTAHAISMVPAVYLLFQLGIVPFHLKNVVFVCMLMLFIYTWIWFIMAVFWKGKAEELNGHISKNGKPVSSMWGVRLLYMKREEMKSARVLVAVVTVAMTLICIVIYFI